MEAAQPVEEERQPLLADVSRVDQSRIDNEQRDDLIACCQSGSQRKVVGYSQITADPPNCRGQLVTLKKRLSRFLFEHLCLIVLQNPTVR